MDRFFSAAEIYGGGGGGRLICAGVYVLDGVRAGAVGLGALLDAPKGEVAEEGVKIVLPSVLLRRLEL